MTEEETKECFGFFMSGKDCTDCSLLKRCYAKWKRDGEPDKMPLKLPHARQKKKCNCD